MSGFENLGELVDAYEADQNDPTLQGDMEIPSKCPHPIEIGEAQKVINEYYAMLRIVNTHDKNIVSIQKVHKTTAEQENK